MDKFLIGLLKVILITAIGLFRFGMHVFSEVRRWYVARYKVAAVKPVVTAEAQKVPDIDPLVLNKAEVLPSALEVYKKPDPPVASQVLTFNLEAQTGLPIGVAWLYLYAEEKKARRVVKFTHSGIAAVVCGGKKSRYYFRDVGYIPSDGISCIQQEFLAEIRALLGRNKFQGVVSGAGDIQAGDMKVQKLAKPSDVRQAVDAAPSGGAATVASPTAEQIALALSMLRASNVVPAPVLAPVNRGNATPAKEESEKPAPSTPTPVVDRSVKGSACEGRIVQLGTTQKDGASGPYSTFCMTINDGRREVPFTGVEVKRLAGDLDLSVGDHVRVVDMGRLSFDKADGGKGWKNLVQISRVG